jgi:hypothetical protein
VLNQYLLLAGLAILTLPAAAQAPATKAWSPALTPDGYPDLQGNWLNKSATPLERPKELEGRPFLTDDEVAELKRRADRLFKNGQNDYAAGDNLFLAVWRTRSDTKVRHRPAILTTWWKGSSTIGPH